MRDPTNAHSWEAAQLCDALRHVPREGLAARYAAPHQCQWDRVVNQLTLPALYNEVQSLSFFMDLANLKDATVYLLSKTLNQRCQLRKFGAVALRCCEASDEVALQLRKIMLCSLLGNYTACNPATRPRAECRLKLYQVLYEQPRHFTGWLKGLMTHDVGGRLVVMFALREFLCFAIADNPALHAVVAPVMNLQAFAAITHQAMNEVRSWLDRELYEPFSAVSLSLQKGDELRPQPWCSNLNPGLEACHKALLSITYRRPKRTLFQCFWTVRKTFKPAVTAVAEDDTQLCQQAVEALMSDELLLTAAPMAAIAAAEESPLQTGVEDVSSTVSPVQQRALVDLLDQLLLTRPKDVLRQLLPWLEHFGVPRHVLDIAREVNIPVKDGVLSDEKLRKRLSALRLTEPHAYNLIQCAAQIIDDRSCIQTLSVLPVHYWRNQMQAIQERYGLAETGLLQNMLYFVYCDVCGVIYSLVRDFSSVYKQQYTHGLRDVLVNYDTDEIFCKQRKKSYSHRQCGEHPLRQVFLLGQVIEYRKRTYLMCPQYGCGMPMVMDPTYCSFNERGIACCDCTRAQALQARKDFDEALSQQWIAPMGAFLCCELCQVELRRPSQMFWYPHNVLVCRAHANTSLARRCAEVAASQQLDREQTVRLLRELDAARQRTRTNSFPKGRKYDRKRTRR